MKRDELRRQARHLVIGCPGCTEDACTYCLVPGGEDTVDQIMEFVDSYVDSILANLAHPHQELWTAKQVAQHLDLSNEDSARATMSRRKIRSVKVTNPVTGAAVTRYPADEVRAIRETRKAPRK